ncbi:MAG TPA: multidrug effflux MFS transporter [Gammaproteobacteria bacterium]|jgi:Bcr/CflA subfamily drug resistance transporter|nr:multidrug effflux MFS transporter [Gammaproteobacteria bacterium]
MHYLRIILLICLTSSIARFALDSYLPSLPALSQYFQTSPGYIQMTLTLYLLGFSLSQLIYGPLSDYYGRRIIMLYGLTIFIIGNLLCALAFSAPLLLLARFIVGVGAGSCGVLNRAIASDCFKGSDFSKAWSHTTTALVLTLCIAPIMGGYIQEWYGWRANFAIAFAYAMLVWAAVVKFLPETNSQTLSFTSTLWVTQFNTVVKNYYAVLTTPSFIIGTLCYTLAFAGLIAYFQVSSFLFTNQYQLRPSEYGWCSLLIACSYLTGGIIVNQFVTRLGTQCLLFIGTFLLLAGGITMMFTYMCNYSSVFSVLLPATIYTLGARIIIPNAIANSLEELRHLGGSTSAVIGFMQMSGSFLLSLWIASYSHITSFILGGFLAGIGIITFGISYASNRIKNHSTIGIAKMAVRPIEAQRSN